MLQMERLAWGKNSLSGTTIYFGCGSCANPPYETTTTIMPLPPAANDVVPAVLALFKVLTTPLVHQATYIHNINPPPESAACGVGKLCRWSKPAEPTTLTLTLALTLTHSHSHTHCLHLCTFTCVQPHLLMFFVHTISTIHCLARLPRHDCHQSCSSLTPHWIVLLCVHLHHHLMFCNLTVEGRWICWHGDSYWFILMLMMNISKFSFSFSLFQAVTPPAVLFLGCRVLVRLTSHLW
jgi:hypothetical protein